MRRIKVFLSFLIIILLFQNWKVDDTSPLFSFGVVSDVQYSDRDNWGSRFYRLSPGKLAEAVEIFNSKKVDFVLSLGDYINDKFKSFDTLNTITNRLNMPLYHVAGNHDFEGSTDNHTGLLSTLKLKKFYYSFTLKGWRMIILNGNDISVFANAEKSQEYFQATEYLEKLKRVNAPNANLWNGAIGKEQLSWLKNELKEAQVNNEKVIIACHFPLVSSNANELLWNYEEVCTLIENFPNVFAYFNGHGHSSQYLQKNGVNHVMFRGMVEEDTNSFAIVSVYEDHIEINGYGKEVNLRLKE